MMKFLNYFLLIAVFALSGCRLLYDLLENTANNFRHEKKVKKISNPVRSDVRLSALWIGHVTVLIQMDDKVIITDPFLTDNIAEIQKRVVEPGIEFDSLKKLDVILLSHPHFDHTQLGSLSLLEDKFPNANLVFPEGLEEFLPDFSFELNRMKKADEKNKIYTGESRNIGGVKITTVAAFHWGGRYGFDGLIWGYDSYTGYIIEYNGMTVFFAGDTSYDDEFYKWLGKRYSIDLAIIPIGPCSDCNKTDKPYRHLYPPGAIKILKEANFKVMMPVHYGTIIEKSYPDYPKDVIIELLKKEDEMKKKVKILNIGEQVILKMKGE